MNKTIAFVVNNPAYFVSHRLAIGVALLEQGHKVYVISPGECPLGLEEQGFIFQSVSMSRKGKNIFSELNTIFLLYKHFKQIKPEVVHLVTIKPYLYGGIAARLAGVKAVVSAVAGLGVLFSQDTAKSKLLRAILYPLYRFAFGHSNQKVIFQNRDDMQLLRDFAGLTDQKTVLIRGAGVDLMSYPYCPEPEGEVVISLASRLLKDKGVDEFAEASRILQQRGVSASFWLIGTPDPGNANTVTQAQLDDWERAGLVKCFGFRSDIAELFASSHIVTLPSFYGEGLPKVLIEAAACGRAVVTTDHPGCRDAIEPDKTGLLVPVRDAVALADALEKLIAEPAYRKKLGVAGRALAESVFDVEKVIDAHMDVYHQLGAVDMGIHKDKACND